jgi:hypothetical protein
MKYSKALAVPVLLVFFVSVFAGVALSEDKLSVKGKITGFDIDAKTVVITTDDGKEMTFVIENDKALKKLDDRLFKDDEVKIRYIIRDGKNIINQNNDFRGTKPGC